MDVSRRRLLAGLGGASAVALAGCTGGSPGRTSTAVFVTNERDEETRVTLRIYRLPPGAAASETASTETAGAETTGTGTSTRTASPGPDDLEQVYFERATLAPDGGFAVAGEDVPNADLRLRVVTTNGPEGSYNWDRIDELSSIDIRIEASTVQFVELD
jgi:hypothetical protein